MKPQLNNTDHIAIIGNTNTGKSNLLFYLASQCDTKKKYLLGYPIYVDGFTAINSIDDIRELSDCVLCIDELSKYFPIWQNKSNIALIEFLQFAQHNRVKLIFTTQLSQAITKQVEAFIGCWAIKKITMHSLKNGSMPKNILKYSIKHPNITGEFIKLENKEYVWYNTNGVVGENGIKEFPFMNIGKHWKNN